MGADPAAEEQFGPYLVYERLGVGGMATVHRALERAPDGGERMVALKRLLPHLAEDASFVKSFVREAKLASILNHVNIVQTFELGRVGTEYFISMEYIDGRDLRRLLRHARKVTGPPPIHITVGLMIQLADALDYAHHRVDEEGHPLGLVHRDVSPSNLLVTSAGHLKVIDFGIAKAQSAQLRTQTGRVKGKLAYMAPEAITARELDARSDIWAVGVILHELLTARPLFASKNEYQTLIKVQRGDILAPSTFNQACPPELDAIVFKALARDPDERYRSAGELREDLHRLRAQYELQAGYRDIAEWIEWAFSLEMPPSFSGQDSTGISGVAPIPATPKPRVRAPRARNPDEEEAAAIAWGTGEADEAGEDDAALLDDVPDVSAKHLTATRADLAPAGADDIPTPTPSHGADDPSAKVEISPELADPSTAAALARGTAPPVARGSAPHAAQRRPGTPSSGPRSDRAPTVRAPSGAGRRSSGPMPAVTPQRTTAPGIAVQRRTPSPTVDVPPIEAAAPAGELPPAIDLPPQLDPAELDSLLDEPIEIVAPKPVERARSSEPPPVVGPSLLDADALFGPEADAATTRPALSAMAPSAAAEPAASRPARPSTPPELTPPPSPPPDLPPVPVVRFSKTHSTVEPPDAKRPSSQRLAVRGPSGPRPTVAPPRAEDTPAASAARTPRPSNAPAATAAPVAPTRPPRRVFLILGGATVVIGAAGAAYMLMSHRKAAEPTAAPPPLAPPPPAMGNVAITTEPADADIVIDHQPAHHGSPWQSPLAAGVHQIEIRHAGYKAWMTSLELSPNETQGLHVALEQLAAAPAAAASASLSVSTTPAGLTAVLDGKRLPSPTPIRLDVPVGQHTIALLENGAEVWHETFDAEASSDYEYNPSFTADKQRERAERAARPRPADTAGSAATGSSTPVAAPVPITVRAADVVRISGTLPAGTVAPASALAKLCIDPTGTVTSAEVLGVDDDSARALATALRTWRYQPYRRAGVALAACFTVAVHP